MNEVLQKNNTYRDKWKIQKVGKSQWRVLSPMCREAKHREPLDCHCLWTSSYLTACAYAGDWVDDDRFR